MHSAVDRKTVDKAKSLRGFGTLLSFGPKLQRATDGKPDGLLHNENFFWGLFPSHAGIRQYWRDFESLERWTRALPHQRWCKLNDGESLEPPVTEHDLYT